RAQLGVAGAAEGLAARVHRVVGRERLAALRADRGRGGRGVRGEVHRPPPVGRARRLEAGAGKERRGAGFMRTAARRAAAYTRGGATASLSLIARARSGTGMKSSPGLMKRLSSIWYWRSCSSR